VRVDGVRAGSEHRVVSGRCPTHWDPGGTSHPRGCTGVPGRDECRRCARPIRRAHEHFRAVGRPSLVAILMGRVAAPGWSGRPPDRTGRVQRGWGRVL